jgi:hypothetical protein
MEICIRHLFIEKENQVWKVEILITMLCNAMQTLSQISCLKVVRLHHFFSFSSRSNSVVYVYLHSNPNIYTETFHSDAWRCNTRCGYNFTFVTSRSVSLHTVSSHKFYSGFKFCHVGRGLVMKQKVARGRTRWRLIVCSLINCSKPTSSDAITRHLVFIHNFFCWRTNVVRDNPNQTMQSVSHIQSAATSNLLFWTLSS